MPLPITRRNVKLCHFGTIKTDKNSFLKGVLRTSISYHREVTTNRCGINQKFANLKCTKPQRRLTQVGHLVWGIRDQFERIKSIAGTLAIESSSNGPQCVEKKLPIDSAKRTQSILDYSATNRLLLMPVHSHHKGKP